MNDQQKPQIERDAGSGKFVLSAMLGTVLLIAAVFSGVAAYYAQADYCHASDYAQSLRNKPDDFSNPYLKKDEIVAENESRANRRLLAAVLSGTGCFIFGGGAFLLLRNAHKSYRRRKKYEAIDWNAIRLPTGRVVVKYGKLYDVLLISGASCFGAVLIVSLIYTFVNQTSGARDSIKIFFVVVLPGFALVAPVCYLLWQAKRRRARLFDASGITRGDDRHFAWNEFRGVRTRTVRSRTGYLWVIRHELVFADGETARVVPHHVANREEVSGYVACLPPARPKAT